MSIYYDFSSLLKIHEAAGFRGKVQHGYGNTRVPVVGTRQARVPARHGTRA